MITYVYDYLPKIVDVNYERAMKPSVADRVAQLGGLWGLEKKFNGNFLQKSCRARNCSGRLADCDRHS